MERRPSYSPVDDARKQRFLEVLSETGSIAAAAAAATPHGTSEDRRGLSTFAALRKRDPLFEAEVQAARERFMGRVEAEIARRALDPESADSRLLLRIAQRFDPSWAEHRKTELTGTIEHRAAGSDPAVLTLRAEDVLLLAPEEQRTLVALVERIRELREPVALPEPEEGVTDGS